MPKSNSAPSTEKIPAPQFNLSESSSPAADDYASQLPSHFHLLHLLGEGAFSKVYKAINTKTQQVVAIKIISKIDLLSKQLQNVRNEITIMSKLNHINILKLLELFNFSNYCYLILEYCDGGEIFNKIIEYTYFLEDLSRHVFKQLLDAIKHLHANNIVHRDIKPENLLYQRIEHVPRPEAEFRKVIRQSDDDTKVDEGVYLPGIGGGGIGVIKLADFGLAKQLKTDPLAVSNLKTPCGTAGYTAPEVITCNSKGRLLKNSLTKANHYSKAVDVWSLGCFLYTILCGFPPFYDENQEQLSQKILTGNYVFLQPWWDEIGDEAKHLITRMLDINPETRITLEEIYAHPWVRKAGKQSSLEDTHYFHQSTTLKSPLHSTEHLECVDDVLAPPPLSSAALLSPRAEAIKRVFNNPAMGNEASVQFIENIADTSEDSFDEFIPPVKKPTRKIPKTPNPPDVSFKNVFDVALDEDDDEEEEDDDVTSLRNGNISSSSSSVILGDADYQTRSSSVISGLNGDFKFTLNLNDSNLLSRRKSSVSRHKSRASSIEHPHLATTSSQTTVS